MNQNGFKRFVIYARHPEATVGSFQKQIRSPLGQLFVKVHSKKLLLLKVIRNGSQFLLLRYRCVESVRDPQFFPGSPILINIFRICTFQQWNG